MAVDLPEHLDSGKVEQVPRKSELPPFTYHELPPNEIRLISFTDATVPEGFAEDKFEGRVEVTHFFTEYAPPYIALSYTSDNQNDFVPITVNDDSTLLIPRTVREALAQIYSLRRMFTDGLQKAVGESYQTPEVFLWIDCLCVNQTDNREKSLQVSRMANIFSEAYTSLVWLGSFDDVELHGPGAEILFEILEHPSPRTVFPKIMQFRLTDQASRDAFTDRPDRGLPEIIKQFLRIIERPWFQRVWTLQEYSLSYRRPCVLLGWQLFKLEALHYFGTDWIKNNKSVGTEAWRTSQDLASVAATRTNTAFGPEPLDDFIRAEFFGTLSPANKLLWLMMNYPRKARIPHDFLYGMLAIVDPSDLPEELEPDYDQPFNELCQRWTRFFINETRDLRILMSGQSQSSKGRRAASWAADFSNLTPTTTVPSTLHTGSFSPDGTTLELEGVHCGKVRRTFKSTSENAEQDFLTFHDTVIRESSEIQGIPHSAAWHTFWTYLISQAAGVKKTGVSMPGNYESAGEYLESLHDEAKEWVLSSFEMYTFVLLGNGSIMRCLPRRELNEDGVSGEQYSVWAFKGATQKFVVRREADREGYSYVGWLSEDFEEELGGFQGLLDHGPLQMISIV